MAAVGNDCYFFFTSTCAKGEACPFRHVESAKTSRIICQHWQTTGCLRPMCKFRHSDFHVQVNYSEIPCYWENQPVGCNKPNCAYKHNKPRPDFKAAVAPQLKPASPEEKENGRTKNEAGSEIVDQFVMPTVKPVIIDPESEASNSSPVKKPPSKDTVNTSEKEKESSVIDDKEKEEKRTGTEIGKKKKTGVLAKKKGKLGTTPKVVKKVKKKVEGSPAATIVPLKRKRVSNAETERGDAVPVKKKVKDRLGVIPNTQKKAEESVEEEESSSSSSSDSDDSIENVKVLSMEEIFRQKALESMMKKRAAEGKPMLPAYGTSQKKSGPVSSRLSKPVIPNNRPKQPVTFDNRPKTAVTTGNRQKKTTVVANSRLNKPAVIKKKPKVPSPPPTPELESEGEDEGDETGEEEEEKEDEATNEDEKDESSSTESESSSSESSDSESGEVRRVVVNLDAEKAAREKAKASLAKRPHGVIRRPESTTTTSTISKKRRVVRDEQPISSSAQQRLSIKERLGKPISSSVSSVIVGRSVTKRVSSSSSSEEAEEEGGEGSNVDNEDDNESISDVKIKSLDEIREEKLARLGHSPIKDRLGPEKTVDEDVEKNGRQILLSEDVNSQKKARKRPWSSGSRQKKTKVVQEVGGEEDQRTVSATSPVESEPVERVPKLQIDEEEPECLFESLKRRAFLKKTQQLSENVPSDTKDDESDGVEKVEEEDDDEGVGGKRKKHKHKHKHKKHKKSKSERQIYVPPAKKHVITEVLEKVKKMPSLLSGREDLLEFEDRANVKNNKPTSTNASTAVESVQQRPKPRAAAMWAAGLTVSSKGIGARPYLRKGMDVEKNDSDDEDKAPFQRSSLTTSKLSSSSVTSASVKDNSRSAVPVVKTFSQIMAEKRQKRMQAEEGSGPRSSDARINSPDHSISSPSRLSSRADNSKPRAPITPIRFDVDGVSKAEQPSFPKLSNTSILNRGGPSKSATSSISMSSRAPFAVATKSHKSPINKDNVNSSLSSSSTLPVSDIRPAYKTARAKKLFNKKAASKTISEASPASDSPAHISKLSVDDSTPSVDNVQHHHHHCHHHTENTSASGDATVALKSPTGDEKKQRRASTATESHQKRSSLDDEFSFFDGGEDIEDISDIVGKDVEPIDDLLQDIDDLLA